MKKLLIIFGIVVVLLGLLSFRVISGRRAEAESANAKASLLGVSVRNMTNVEFSRLGIDKGVLVYAVHANSPAEQHGLKNNDVILQINGQFPKNKAEYDGILDKALMQERMNFGIMRGTEEISIHFGNGYASLYNNLGNAYVKDKRYELAMDAYEKAISIDPEFAMAYYNLGSLYESRKNYAKAEEYYTKAISHNKDLNEAYQRLTGVYNRQGKYEDAVNVYKKIVQSAPGKTISTDLQPVEVIYAAKGEIKNQLKTSGTIEARANVAVFPKVAGLLVEMRVKEGDIVNKGQVLAVVEHEELELQLQQAEAALNAAQVSYNQTKQLAQVRTMSQVSQAQAGKDAAEAALQQVVDLSEVRMDTQIQQAKAALDALKANLEKIKAGARKEEKEQIKSTVTQADANLANAQSNYDRMKKLFEHGAISRQMYEGVETQLEVAKAQSKAAQQQLKMIEDGPRDEDVKALEAQVKQAEATLNLAKKQAEKQTWQKEIDMAQAQVNQAKAALESAAVLVKAKSWEAEITAAETQLTQARVMRDLSKKRLEDAYIKSPIGGVISVRHLDGGSMVNPAAPVFEIVDISVIKANVDIMESDLKRINSGNMVWIQVNAMDEPVQGKITTISPTLDETSRTAKVEITVENPRLALKPGMFARVNIPTDMRTDAVLLPHSAVIKDEINHEDYVFVADSGKCRKKLVELGLSEGNLVEIAMGLEANTPVIVSGYQKLRDGELIQIVNNGEQMEESIQQLATR